jgi:hypothetical protein
MLYEAGPLASIWGQRRHDLLSKFLRAGLGILSPPQIFENPVGVLPRDAVPQIGFEPHPMVSGAGHDVSYLN